MGGGAAEVTDVVSRIAADFPRTALFILVSTYAVLFVLLRSVVLPAKALVMIWPDLKMTGKAYRVPVRTGSIAEINAVLSRPVTKEEVREAFVAAAQTDELRGIMDVLTDEWTSARIVGDPHSSIIDLPLIDVIGGNLVSVAAWYDNEMGYATRLAEVAALVAK